MNSHQKYEKLKKEIENYRTKLPEYGLHISTQKVIWKLDEILDKVTK